MVRTDPGSCDTLQKLFDPGRWTDLQELFQQDLYRLHSLTSTSLLNIHLQVRIPSRPRCPVFAGQQNLCFP